MAHLRRIKLTEIGRTAALLKELLEGNPSYRRKWEQHARRRRSRELSQAAVAKVLALHLWDIGEREDTDMELPRGLRHRVRRALGGELSGETLGWIVDAFEMSPKDEQELWLAFAGGNELGQGIVNTIEIARPLLHPQRHRTISLFERFKFDSTGLLLSRHTMHLIRAVEADVECYSVTHEPFMASLEMIAGGKLKQQSYPGGQVNDEIWFEAPIKQNATVAMEYITHYRPEYRPLEVRRAIRARCENIDIAVQFDTSCPPATISFCAWSSHYGGSTAVCKDISIDSNGYAHQFVPFAENTVLGFEWRWRN